MEILQITVEIAESSIISADRPDIEVAFTVVCGGDEIRVLVQLDDTGNEEEDGKKVYDASIITGNGDWASLRDQQLAIGLALDRFYADGYNTKFGILTGDTRFAGYS